MAGMTDDVKKWAEAGGILVRVEFLDAAGNVDEIIPDRVATDYRLTPAKFAYLAMEQERPNFMHVTGFWKDGDEWVLQSDDKRIAIGPLWMPQLATDARNWRKSVEFPEAAVDEMDEVFNEM